MRKILIALLFITAGCGDQRPPAPTAEQNEQLNEAEEMLDEEGPAPEGTGPNSD